jgi:hypothetical protein
MKDYYKEIDTPLTRLEQGKYPTHDIDWVCNRIDWCWRFRKITTAQMAELADRACAYMENS